MIDKNKEIPIDGECSKCAEERLKIVPSTEDRPSVVVCDNCGSVEEQ